MQLVSFTNYLCSKKNTKIRGLQIKFKLKYVCVVHRIKTIVYAVHTYGPHTMTKERTEEEKMKKRFSTKPRFFEGTKKLEQ